MKVLLVSIAFPPKRDPESLQVAKYFKYLKDEPNISLEVITSKNPTLFMEVDETLMPYSEGANIVSELKIFENRYLNFFIRKISPSLLRYPDSKFTFWWQAKKILKSVKKPDIIYSRSYPVSSTLLALQLKRKWNVPWILHLSDPWAVATEKSKSPAELPQGAVGWNKRMEEKCLGLADKICLTSHKTIALYKEVYPQFNEKFVYMPNVFDDVLVVENPFMWNDQLTFLYTGGFADFRSPSTLLQAIQSFWDSNSSRIHNNVQFLFTGEVSRTNRSIFEQYSHIPIVKHVGVIPYKDMLALQKKADILINVDTDISDPKQAVYFPSKLLDYIVAQRRIIAITNNYSTTYEVVNGKYGDCFGFDDVDKLSNYFTIAFDKFLYKDLSFFEIQNIDQEFSAASNAKRLISIFNYLAQYRNVDEKR